MVVENIEICRPYKIQMPWKEMAEEMLAIKEQSVSNPEGTLTLEGGALTYQGLTSLCLYGYGPFKTLPDHCYSEEEREVGKAWHFEKECPLSIQWLKENLPIKKISRIRLQFLAPGGFLAPHKDNHNNQLSTLCLNVYNPDSCHFLFEDIPPLDVGSGTAWFLNTSRVHSVANLSNQCRVSLIILGEFDWDKIS